MCGLIAHVIVPMVLLQHCTRAHLCRCLAEGANRGSQPYRRISVLTSAAAILFGVHSRLDLSPHDRASPRELVKDIMSQVAGYSAITNVGGRGAPADIDMKCQGSFIVIMLLFYPQISADHLVAVV